MINQVTSRFVYFKAKLAIVQLIYLHGNFSAYWEISHFFEKAFQNYQSTMQKEIKAIV